MEINGEEVDIIDEGEVGQEELYLTPEEIQQARENQQKRRVFMVSATLTKISGTSRMLKNKKFKALLKMKIKSKKGEKIHPKILDIMNKINMKNQVEIIDLSSESSIPSGLQIFRVKTSSDQKIYCLEYILRTKCQGLCMIFVNSINAAKKIKSVLEQLEFKVCSLHSHMKQAQRVKKIENFSSGKKQILITTDVASRGIDINNVENVIHFHTPVDLDTFIHRAGRTARIGNEGKCIVITDAHDSKRFVKYQKDLGYIKLWDFLPSELMKNQELVDQAMQVEKKSYTIDRQ